MFKVKYPFGDRLASFLSNQKCLLYYMSKKECKMKL